MDKKASRIEQIEKLAKAYIKPSLTKNEGVEDWLTKIIVDEKVNPRTGKVTRAMNRLMSDHPEVPSKSRYYLKQLKKWGRIK
jgi:hypothetical protein